MLDLRQEIPASESAKSSGRKFRPALPVVVLEPSCASVFRDELHEPISRRCECQQAAQQTFLLSEFLEQEGRRLRAAQLERKALVHGHCHHKAIMQIDEEKPL